MSKYKAMRMRRVLENEFLLSRLKKDPKQVSGKLSGSFLTVEKKEGRSFLVLITLRDGEEKEKIFIDEFYPDGSLIYGIGEQFKISSALEKGGKVYVPVGSNLGAGMLLQAIGLYVSFLGKPITPGALLFYNSFSLGRSKFEKFLLALFGVILDVGFIIGNFYMPTSLFQFATSSFLSYKFISGRKINLNKNFENIFSEIKKKGKSIDIRRAIFLSNLLYLNERYDNDTTNGDILYSPSLLSLSIKVLAEDGGKYINLASYRSLGKLSKVKVKINGSKVEGNCVVFSYDVSPKERNRLYKKLLSIEKKRKKVTLDQILVLSLGFAGKSEEEVRTFLGKALLSFTGIEYINGREINPEEHKLYKLLKVNEIAYIGTLGIGNPIKRILSYEKEVNFCLIYINGKFYFPARHVEIKKGKYFVSDPIITVKKDRRDSKREFLITVRSMLDVEGLTTRLIREGKIKVRLIGTYLCKPSIAYILEVNSREAEKELNEFKRKLE